MTRPTLPCLTIFAFCAGTIIAMAQTAPSEAPEPKMPAMPSMEGQQGDVSKPVTQIPPRKKASAIPNTKPVGAAKAVKTKSRPPGAAKPRPPKKGRRR